MSGLTIAGSVKLSGLGQMLAGSLTVPNKATSFSPSDSSLRVLANPTLSWSNGGGALTYDVYLDTVNPPNTKVASAQLGTTFAATTAYSTTYYWRINPINNSGTTTGDVLSFTSSVPTTIDTYMDFESGTSGDILTTSALNAGTHTSIGTWSLSANATTLMFVGNTETTLYNPAKIGATVYTDSGSTRSIKSRLDTVSNNATLTLTSSVDTLSVGFWVTVDSLGGTAQTIDLFAIENPAGGFFVCQIGSNGKMHAHGDKTGTSQVGSDIAGSNAIGVPLWVTMKYARFSTCTLKVYNSSATLLGTSTVDLSLGHDSPAATILVGRLDAHGGSQPPNTSFLNYDDLMIDVTNANFPLGP